MIKYDFKVNPWQVAEQNFPAAKNAAQRLNFLLRYAVLAPSSHNTQPWKFATGKDEIHIYANFDRWLKVADRDQRELHISIGCALENLLIAAEHFGFAYEVVYFPEPGNARLIASVKFTASDNAPSFRNPALFYSVFVRHTNRKPYEPQPLSEEDRRQLQACCVEEGIRLHMTSDLETKRQVDLLVSRADATQFADTSFREELAYWIGQGVFGTPWLFSKMAQMAVSYLDVGGHVAKNDSDLLMSAPVFAVICSDDNDRESQVKVGQVFERVALYAAALGISVQPMSQLVQVPETRAELANLITGGGAFPQQPFRLGYAEPEKEHTPRRRFEEALL
jgi:nitroreductase